MNEALIPIVIFVLIYGVITFELVNKSVAALSGVACVTCF